MLDLSQFLSLFQCCGVRSTFVIGRHWSQLQVGSNELSPLKDLQWWDFQNRTWLRVDGGWILCDLHEFRVPRVSVILQC